MNAGEINPDIRSAQPSATDGTCIVPSPQFRRLIEVERARADRSGLTFALVVFRIAAESVKSSDRLASEVAHRVRTIDHAGWLDQSSLGVILGDTDLAGAKAFIRRVFSGIDPADQPPVEVYLYPDVPEGLNHQESSKADGERPAHPVISRIPPKSTKPLQQVDAGRTTCSTTAISCGAAATRLTAIGPESASEPRGAHGSNPATALDDMPVRPLLDLLVRPLSPWKRGFDLIVAGLGLLVISPLLAIVAVAIKCTSPGPVLFKQRRMGLGGRPFTIYKFRTMCVDAEARKSALRQFSEQDGPAFKMAADPRITPIGHILRKTCIDELPQLLNVLRGEMTLVGPRPLPVDEANGCSPWQRQRLEVTPGLTCIWQVYGKSRVSFAEWMRMDIRYIRTGSFLRDMRLIASTMLAVIRAKASQ